MSGPPCDAETAEATADAQFKTPRSPSAIAAGSESAKSTDLKPHRLTDHAAYNNDAGAFSLNDGGVGAASDGTIPPPGTAFGTFAEREELPKCLDGADLRLLALIDPLDVEGNMVNGGFLHGPSTTSPASLLAAIESTPTPKWDDVEDTPAPMWDDVEDTSFDFISVMEPDEIRGLLDVVIKENPLWFFYGCGPSPRLHDSAEELIRKDTSGAALSLLQRWNMDTLCFINRRNPDPRTFVAEANAMRMALAGIIDSTSGMKNWAGHSNVGDPISGSRRVGILKHYAPPSCLIYDINSRIHRKNQCIVPWLNSIPISMHKEAGGTWDEENHPQIIQESIFFVDLIPLIPDSKSHFDWDVTIFVTDANSTRVDLELSGFLLYCLHARAHMVLHDEPVTVAVASRACWDSSFHEHAPMLAVHADVLGMLAHGQCWAMRLPLMNMKVHTDELIEQYSYIVLHLYLEIARIKKGSGFMPDPKDVSRVAQRFGARNDDLSPEERQARLAEMEEHLERMRAIQDAAWAAYHDEAMSEEEISAVADAAASSDPDKEEAVLEGEIIAQPRVPSWIYRMIDALARGRATQAAGGYQNLVTARSRSRATHAARGWQSLATGRATMAAGGYQNLVTARASLAAGGFKALKKRKDSSRKPKKSASGMTAEEFHAWLSVRKATWRHNRAARAPEEQSASKKRKASSQKPKKSASGMTAEEFHATEFASQLSSAPSFCAVSIPPGPAGLVLFNLLGPNVVSIKEVLETSSVKDKLLVGDVLVGVDGVDVWGWTLEQIVERIKDTAGKERVVKVWRK